MKNIGNVDRRASLDVLRYAPPNPNICQKCSLVPLRNGASAVPRSAKIAAKPAMPVHIGFERKVFTSASDALPNLREMPFHQFLDAERLLCLLRSVHSAIVRRVSFDVADRTGTVFLLALWSF
jgi:hypothetical protein